MRTGQVYVPTGSNQRAVMLHHGSEVGEGSGGAAAQRMEQILEEQPSGPALTWGRALWPALASPWKRRTWMDG